jgi:2-dehydro-3-deoxyglucarate aldolase/4-hydroxy-2-oxoheptanedioate aldolase
VAHDDYSEGDVQGKMQSANAETMIIALIETSRGIENVEGIAALDGIDVLWIGHFDLTNSMGIPAQFEHPAYQAAVDRVLEACRKNGKAAGFMTSSVDDGRALVQRGFRCLAYWGDIWIYQEGLRRGIAGIRAGLAARA